MTSHSLYVLDRLRNPEQSSQRLVDYKDIQAGFPAFSVAEEGENGCLHYQGFVIIDITNASYAQKFKRKGYKGNETYSTKLVPSTDNDKQRTLQYLCKGKNKDTLPIVINNTLGLTLEHIAILHQQYWEENSHRVDKERSTASKKEKKESNREKVYKDFIEYLKKDEKVETGKYKLEWIGKQFFKFQGIQPRPELTNWIKGTVFSAQAVLLHGDTSETAERSIDRWIDRILS